MDASALVDGRPLQDVLDEQMLMLEQALAFNRAIAKRMANQGQISRATSPSPTMASLTARPKHPTMPSINLENAQLPALGNMSLLSEPFLPHGAVLDNDHHHGGAVKPRRGLVHHGSGQLIPHDDANHSLKPAGMIFPDEVESKKKILESFNTRPYSVDDLYWTEGFCQMMARSEVFSHLTIAVIALNTLWIGIDTDLDSADILCNAPLLFQVVGNLFCTYFSAELTLRFLAFRNKRDAFKDGWFLFDAIMVGLMVWETWVEVAIYRLYGSQEGNVSTGRQTSALRIFRILRISRVARVSLLVKSMPELVVLLRGMAMALRSAFAVLFMEVLIIYIYGIIFTLLLKHEDVGRGNFENVPQAMFFLVTQLLAGFDIPTFSTILEAGSVYFVIFVSYIFIASLVMLNMLIGVICQVISNVSDLEEEERAAFNVQEQIGTLVRQVDADNSGYISVKEFQQMMEDPTMMRRLQDIGVDVLGISDFGRCLFASRDQLAVAEFLAAVTQLRGSKIATVKDVVDVRMFVSQLARESPSSFKASDS